MRAFVSFSVGLCVAVAASCDDDPAPPPETDPVVVTEDVADCAVKPMDAVYAEPGPPMAATTPADACVAREHDVIIVLGCPNEDDGTPGRCQENRADTALELSAAGYGDRFITTGGAVQNEFVEAETLRTLLIDRGAEADRIFVEPQAMHTDENLYFGSQIMIDNGWASAVVVSDASGHLTHVALCDSNCCVKLGRLSVFAWATDEGSVTAGHYALFPQGADIAEAECNTITAADKFMCLALSSRLACADDFQL